MSPEYPPSTVGVAMILSQKFLNQVLKAPSGFSIKSFPGILHLLIRIFIRICYKLLRFNTLADSPIWPIYHRRRAIYHRRPAIYHRRPAIYLRRRAIYHRRPAIYLRRRAIYHRRPAIYHPAGLTSNHLLSLGGTVPMPSPNYSVSQKPYPAS